MYLIHWPRRFVMLRTSEYCRARPIAPIMEMPDLRAVRSMLLFFLLMSQDLLQRLTGITASPDICSIVTPLIFS